MMDSTPEIELISLSYSSQEDNVEWTKFTETVELVWIVLHLDGEDTGTHTDREHLRGECLDDLPTCPRGCLPIVARRSMPGEAKHSERM